MLSLAMFRLEAVVSLVSIAGSRRVFAREKSVDFIVYEN